MPGLTHDSIDPLDSLESQIEELERKILGNSDISEKDTTIVDSLLLSSNVINNTVSGRESFIVLFERLNQLGKFLDPSFEDSLVDVASKTKVVLESEHELRNYLVESRKLSELNNSLTGESFKQVPSLIEKLRKVSEETIHTQNHYDKLKEKVENLTENYSTVLRTLNRSLLLFEAQVSMVEESRQEKEVLDE